MALSRKNQNHMPDGNPASSTRPILWSRIHEVKKTSLMHSDQVLTATDGFTTIKSLCYRVGRSPGCILFDVSSRQEDQAAFLSILAAQFPKLWGVAFHQENKQHRMIEIGFLDDEAREHALKVGMIFDSAEEKVRILPTLAMKPETSIVRLALSNLPFIQPERLLTGIKSSLKPYGHIVDVGLSFDKAHQLYIGQGYAVIDTYQHSTVEENDKYQSLTHNIPWFVPRDSESSDDMELDDLSLYTREAGFYATWNNMPTWCTYCHDDSGDHTASTCQQRPGFQNVVCWECGKAGHYQTACPAPKKAKKGSLPTTTKINKERQQRKPRDQRRRSRTPPSGRREATLGDFLGPKLAKPATNGMDVDRPEQQGEATDTPNPPPAHDGTHIQDEDDLMKQPGDDDLTKDKETIDASSTATPQPPSPLLITGPGEPSNPNSDATLAETHGVDNGSTEPMSELEADSYKKRATESTEDDLDEPHNKNLSSPVMDSTYIRAVGDIPSKIRKALADAVSTSSSNNL